MRAHDFIIEAGNLSTSELVKYQSRIAAFIHKIQAKSPFTTVDGRRFIADPKQLPELKKFLLNPNAKGSISLRSLDGKETISTSKLVKTSEFGGQSVASTGSGPTDASLAGKEQLPVKPPQVFKTTDIADVNLATAKDLQRAGAFKVKDLYSKITNSQQLNALGTYGQAIISCAQQINKGNDPKLPEGLTNAQLKALIDYAGEYLGILAMYKGTADFPKRESFLKFIGRDLGTSMLYFPVKSNTPLADSFAIQDAETGHTIYLSSKGSGGGAAPSLTGLKITDEIAKRKQYKDAVKFIQVAQASGTIEQPFQLMNFLATTYPGAVDEKFAKFLPWKPADIMAVDASRRDKSAKTKLPARLQKFISTFTFRKLSANATAGGILHYVVSKEIQRIVNAGTIKNFQACVLEVLSENFVQIYTQPKKATLETYVLWPANVDGVVTVESKASAVDPTSAGLSFRVSK
jgi:hypothetical protein